MSNVAITGNASGTGVFTVASPNSNTDRVLTLPDSSGTVSTTESTLAQFNVTGSAPLFACRAWVNFNGTGTVAIRASGNVSSITDLGVGTYNINFAIDMQDTGYSAVGSAVNASSFVTGITSAGSNNSDFCQVRVTDAAGNLNDPTVCNYAFFR